MTAPTGTESAKTPRLFLHSLPTELFGPGLSPSALVNLSKRALALAEPCDTVIVESEVDAAYLDYLRTLGRGPERVFIPSQNPGTLAERMLADEELLAQLRKESWRIEPYFAGKAEQALARALDAPLHGSTTDLAERVNHKALLGELLHGAGLPDVETTIVRRVELLPRVENALHAGPVIVRADVGIGGSGVFVLRDLREAQALETGLEGYGEESLFLVQPLHDVRSSPNVQYDLTDSEAELLGASDQKLRDGIHHVGNLSPFDDPCRPEVLAQGQQLAEYVRGLGYRGYLGIDFIITTTNEAFVIELNPRLNTSSFGWLALGNDEKLAMLCLSSLPAPEIESFSELHALLGEEAWIGPDRAHGLLPILPPSAERKKLDLVALGSSKHDAERRAQDLLDQLANPSGRVASGGAR